MKKMALFPCCKDADTLIRNRRLTKEYDITAVITLNDFDETDIEIEKIRKFEQLCSLQIESVLFLDEVAFMPEEELRNRMVFAKEHGMETVASMQIANKMETAFPEAQLITKILQNEDKPQKMYQVEKILEIPVPVFVVYGLGEYTEKFNVQVDLKEYFSQKGYRCAVVSSNPCASILGMSQLPSFLFQNSMSLENKVIHFNRYLYELYFKEGPDVMIIGMPGGVMPLSSKIHEHFGEIPFIVSNAVTVDVGICNIYFEPNLNRAFIDGLEKIMEHKLNFPMDAVCVSSQRYSYDEERSKVAYYYLGRDESRKKSLAFQKLSNKLFNYIDQKKKYQLFDSITDTLAQSIELV